MKLIYFILLTLIFSRCNIIGGESSYQKNPQGLPGTWEAVERTYSYGGPPITEEIENGHRISFKNDGGFSATEAFTCNSGSYTLAADELTFTYACEDLGENQINPFTYTVIFEKDYMILNPKTSVCIEGCSVKYKKLED
ncbi:lipocalin family protein [Echinicola marina]|uniref:lipocalin family protein n=1 Tax=Echinicola marina TaxID=2859768 RepID=UPI001CF6E79E|nr:lipocalin family protein [Echinicola marina]UCS93267.1 lipocalin family protein [Echinicola marina]